MKTICYVDGFNLYYGCLKQTSFKWLDLDLLLRSLLIEQNPQTELIQVKYFTADIKAQLASHGVAAHQAQQAQQDYQRALALRMGSRLKIVKGFHSLTKSSMLSYEVPPSKAKRVDVWRLEEKETDVNIALEAFRDAVSNTADQLVFVSNDSDLAPIFRSIREESLSIKIGVIFPILRQADHASRPGNVTLSGLADWTRRYFHANELACAQLPLMIPTKRKPIKKPAHW